MSFDEYGLRCAATESFESDGSGAGKQVEDRLTVNVPADQIETGLSRNVLHRTRDRIAGIFDLSATKLATDNSQFANICACLLAVEIFEISSSGYFGHVWVGT